MIITKEIIRKVAYVVGGVVLLVVVYWVSQLYITNYVIDDILKRREAEITQKYEVGIAQQDTKIRELETLNKAYQTKFEEITKQLKELKKKKASITQPSTSQEMKERFKALGYHPL